MFKNNKEFDIRNAVYQQVYFRLGRQVNHHVHKLFKKIHTILFHEGWINST